MARQHFLGSSSDEELVLTTDRHIKLCKNNFCHFISIPPTDAYSKSTKKTNVTDEVVPMKEIIIEQKPIKPKKKIRKNFASSRIRSSNGFRKLMKSSEMAWHMDNIRYILECSNATPILSKDQNGYSCCYCSKKYQNPKVLKRHTIAHKNKTDPLKLDSKNLLSRHIVFLDVTALDCEVCGVSIDTLENLMTHLKSDHDVDLHLEIKNHIMPLKLLNNDLNCAVCEVMVQFEDIPVHMAKHYRNYECELCSSVFVNRGMKVDHQKYVHDLELKL